MLSQVYLCNATTHHIQTTQPQQCSYNEQPLPLHQALSQPLAPTGICISATGAWVQVDRLCRSASDTQTSVTPDVSAKTFGERSCFFYAGLSVLNDFTTLILPLLLKPPSRCTCLFHNCANSHPPTPSPSSILCLCVCLCMCVCMHACVCVHACECLLLVLL